MENNIVEKPKDEKLMQFVPESTVDAEEYLKLVLEKILGRDKSGALRPMSDVKLFLYQCKRTGLDPLARQIYAVYRWNSNLGKETITIQTSIDGYRLIAERSGLYGGSDDPIYEEVENSKYPKKSTITVYKLNKMTGERMGIAASARWEEYAQTGKTGEPIQNWGKMPYLMLGKVAEALALRKAFPQELAGIYTDEEMGQTETERKLNLPEPKKNMASKKVIGEVADSILDQRSKLQDHD